VEEGPISQVSKTWKKALRNVCKNKIIKNNNNNAQIYSTTILKKKKKKKCIISSCRTILAPTEKSIMRSPRILLFPKQIVHEHSHRNSHRKIIRVRNTKIRLKKKKKLSKTIVL